MKDFKEVNFCHQTQLLTGVSVKINFFKKTRRTMKG